MLSCLNWLKSAAMQCNCERKCKEFLSYAPSGPKMHPKTRRRLPTIVDDATADASVILRQA